jgi:hypothetical protein
MTPENKKLAMYLGGAIVIGAVGFFVYSFFQKPIVVGNTSVSLGEEEKEEEEVVEEDVPKNTTPNPFTAIRNQTQGSSTSIDWSSDYTKNLFKNIDWTKELNNPRYNTGIK